MSAPHAAIVLAAGGSRRLGRPKQLLLRDGETLVHRAVRLARQTRPSRVIAVLGSHAEAIAAAFADLEAEARINPRWAEGRSSSLQCAADALRGHAGPVLILGCDQPALDVAHLQALLSGAANAVTGCAATVHGPNLGLPAVVTPAVLHSARPLEGDQGFGRCLSALPGDTVWRLAASELEFDIDTPENEQAAIARGLLDAPSAGDETVMQHAAP